MADEDRLDKAEQPMSSVCSDQIRRREPVEKKACWSLSVLLDSRVMYFVVSLSTSENKKCRIVRTFLSFWVFLGFFCLCKNEFLSQAGNRNVHFHCCGKLFLKSANQFQFTLSWAEVLVISTLLGVPDSHCGHGFSQVKLHCYAPRTSLAH